MDSTSISPALVSTSDFLVVENLSKSYKTTNGEFVVLDDINLKIKENEFVSLIGHSGCGKSTLLKILAGLEQATTGQVTLDGKVIRKPGCDRMMVFQHYGLLPWLTVRENVRLAIDEVLKMCTKYTCGIEATLLATKIEVRLLLP